VPTYSSKDLLRVLLDHGWIVKRQVGSHLQLTHALIPGKVTLPHPKKDLAYGTVRSVLKQAGLSEGDLP
jgi:predicted RNA binding protein YcfA (HicA-like mRNA interferase family)